MSNLTVLIIRIGLGTIFIWASLDKIANPSNFAEIIYNYKILPQYLINITALMLPWVEVVIGACLIAGIYLPGAASLGAALLVVFSGAVGFNLIRGLDVQCGCFSVSGEPAGIGTLVRTLFLSALAVFMVIQIFKREKSFFCEKNFNSP